jgi:predicted Zn-dependent protease
MSYIYTRWSGKKSRYSLGPVLGIIISNIFIDNQAFLFYTAVCLRGVFVIYFNVENVDKDKILFCPNCLRQLLLSVKRYMPFPQ